MAGGPGQPKGLTREIILRGAEESLRRLGVDRIDLYYAHEDDPGTPLEETLGAFDELVRQGLVRTIAASNYPAERLTAALRLSEERGLARFEALQPPYNLLDRGGYEGELEEICLSEGLGVATYYSLARGFLSGKYRPGEPLPDSPRAAAVTRDYMHDRGMAVLETLGRVAQAHGASHAQVALAWIMARPGVTCAIASATAPGQARELMGAVDLELPTTRWRPSPARRRRPEPPVLSRYYAAVPGCISSRILRPRLPQYSPILREICVLVPREIRSGTAYEPAAPT